MEKINNEEEFQNILQENYIIFWREKIIEDKNFTNIRISSPSPQGKMDNIEIIAKPNEENPLVKIRRRNERKSYQESFNYIIKNYALNESIIRKYLPYFNSEEVCGNQILSEEFIEEFEEIWDWKQVFLAQPFLSEEFVEKHYYRIKDEVEIRENNKNITGTITSSDNTATNYIFDEDFNFVNVNVNNNEENYTIEHQSNNGKNLGDIIDELFEK